MERGFDVPRFVAIPVKSRNIIRRDNVLERRGSTRCFRCAYFSEDALASGTSLPYTRKIQTNLKS